MVAGDSEELPTPLGASHEVARSWLQGDEAEHFAFRLTIAPVKC